MSNPIRRGAVWFVWVVLWAPPTWAAPEQVTCQDETGSCTQQTQTVSCECANGSAGGGGGSDAIPGDKLQEACHEALVSLCGDGGGSDADSSVTCESASGKCTQSETSFSCGCEGGGETGGGGLDPIPADQLQKACEENLASTCGEPTLPDGAVACESEAGGCTQSPSNVSCECKDGSGGGGGGSSAIAADQLAAACAQALKEYCASGPPPAPEGSVACEDESGSCLQAPETVSCTCKDGSGGGGGGTTGGSPLPQDQLEAACKEALKSVCAGSGGEDGPGTTTGGGTTGDEGETSGGGGETGGGGTGDSGAPAEPTSDTGENAGTTGGAPAATGSGGTADDGGTTGEDPAAAQGESSPAPPRGGSGGETSSGCTASPASRGASVAFILALLLVSFGAYGRRRTTQG